MGDKMQSRSVLLAAIAASSLALNACGGAGGGGSLASMPPPPGDPPPPPTAESVTLFANATPQTFGSAGVSATGTGSGATQGFNALSSADADQVHIRYTSGGYYEIKIPGADWDRLTFAKGVIPADPEFANDFQPQSAPQSGAHLVTGLARTDGYKYSEIASWYDGLGRIGELAFGESTAAGAIPHTGTAVYNGIVSGTSDVVGHDSFDGYFRTRVSGTVQLSFDFAKATLDGSMSLTLGDASLGTYAFENTVFSSGMYSGKFETSAKGQNFFLGQFTGPHGEETIGAWALPFVFTQSGLMTMPDGQVHQAFGAWIAKQ
jgi:hypothetical protein